MRKIDNIVRGQRSISITQEYGASVILYSRRFFFCDLDQILETISNLTTSVSNNFDNLQFFGGKELPFLNLRVKSFNL